MQLSLGNRNSAEEKWRLPSKVISDALLFLSVYRCNADFAHAPAAAAAAAGFRQAPQAVCPSRRRRYGVIIRRMTTALTPRKCLRRKVNDATAARRPYDCSSSTVSN